MLLDVCFYVQFKTKNLPVCVTVNLYYSFAMLEWNIIQMRDITGQFGLQVI